VEKKLNLDVESAIIQQQIKKECAIDMKVDQFQKQLNLLFKKGILEIRIPKKKIQKFFRLPTNLKTVYTYVNTLEKEDLYIGINPRRTESGSAKDISWLTCLVIDVDPVRPKDEPSTDEQHREAIKLAQRIATDFVTRYKTECIVVSSGSGSHIYFPIQPIQVSNYGGLTASLKKWSDKVKKYYKTSGLKIDSIFDLPRIIRIWGSWNYKSNRPCEIVNEYGESGTRAKLEFSQEEPEQVFVPGKIVVSPDLENRFSKIRISNPVIRRMMEGTYNYESRSEADYAFISALLRAGFNTGEVSSLASRNPSGRGVDLKQGDIERVCAKVISQNGISGTIGNTAGKYVANLRNRKSGIPTGLVTLDKATGGFRGGEVTIIAARPGEGKTSLSVQLAHEISKRHRVLLFPTELPASAIQDKIMSRITGINLTTFRDGAFTDEDIKLLENNQCQLFDLDLIIAENFALRVEDIANKVDEVCPDLVIVDYIQALAGLDGGKSSLISQAVHSLVSLSGSRNIPIIIGSQINRAFEDSKMSMDRLKGSGALEEKSRLAIAITSQDQNEYPRSVDFHIMKASYGEPGVYPFVFDTKTCRFSEHG